MPVISSYITLFLSITIIFLLITTKENKIFKNSDKVSFIIIFSLMTIYSLIGLFWVVVSDSVWIYDYNEIIYLCYNILIIKKIYNIIKRGKL